MKFMNRNLRKNVAAPQGKSERFHFEEYAFGEEMHAAQEEMRGFRKMFNIRIKFSDVYENSC